jgi:hypothetical protein
MTSKAELKYQIEILTGIINELNVTDKELKVAKEQAMFDYRMTGIPTTPQPQGVNYDK